MKKIGSLLIILWCFKIFFIVTWFLLRRFQQFFFFYRKCDLIWQLLKKDTPSLTSKQDDFKEGRTNEYNQKRKYDDASLNSNLENKINIWQWQHVLDETKLLYLSFDSHELKDFNFIYIAKYNEQNNSNKTQKSLSP